MTFYTIFNDIFKFTIIDICGFISLLAVGIAAAVQESYLGGIWIVAGYRPGTFIACSVRI